MNTFLKKLLSLVNPLILVKKKVKPFLRTGGLYFAVKLSSSGRKKHAGKNKRYTYAIVEIPSDKLNRFIILPSAIDGTTEEIFLDEIIRHSLNEIFIGYNVEEVCSVKLTRDAELYIEDEFSGNLLEKVKKNLSKRNTGVPSRFLYDENISKEFLGFLKESLSLSKQDLVPGARYHNFSDFFNFPFPDKNEHKYPRLKQIRHKDLSEDKNIFDVLKQKDILLYFPYNSFEHVTDFFEKASSDNNVKEIKVTLYRVAKNSGIMSSLLKALENGIKVTIFVEIKARFDEELNIEYAGKLEKAGAKILYSIPGLKVHAKLALVIKNENGELKKYCYLSTGNFNEKTSFIYTDFGLFTCDNRITEEAENLFNYLEFRDLKPQFKNLLTAQFNMKSSLINLIENEIENSEKGIDAYITLKLNSLEDVKMISKLYEASKKGVKINVIVRGVCCLVPGLKDISKNINVISVVDRFLEHSRVYIFGNNNKPLVFLSSADWMKRNLNRRIEVAFPVYDENLKLTILDLVEIQLNDKVKARMIDKEQVNKYNPDNFLADLPSQNKIYEYLKKIHSSE